MIQCVVKPREIVSVYGKCHIQLSSEEREIIDKQEISEDVAQEDEEEVVSKSVTKSAVSTEVEDSDDEQEVVAQEPVTVASVPTPVKKIIKKAPAPTPEPEPTVVVAAVTAALAEVSSVQDEAPKKKIMKKKVVATA